MTMADFKDDLRARTDHNLTLHPPADPSVGQRMDRVRGGFKILADIVIDECPLGRELSMALTSVEDACMYAIASIARHQNDD